MKEIKLLEAWAESVIEERPLPIEHDIQYKASRAHPDLSPEQALAVYMANELEKNEKVDQQQNYEIDQVEHEVDDVEQEEKNIEAEIARLMQLVKKSR